MKCSACNRDLADPTKSGSDTHMYPVKVDGKLYCVGCDELSDIIDITGRKRGEKTEEKKENIILTTNQNIHPKVPHNNQTKIFYTCPKCKKEACGNSCENCKFPNPLKRGKTN
jgi:hypothetical protein